MATPSEKLEICEVCGASKAKYTCPKCEVRTCCIKCVNIHKQELECDGIRDRTKFVPLNAFTDLDLLSDYRLLEEVGRSVDQLQRNTLKNCTRFRTLPPLLQRLRSAAYRSSVRLVFMPQHFSRRKENTTFFNWKANELFWRIDWIFPQAENSKWTTERVQESTRLSDILESILDPVNSSHKSFADCDTNMREILGEKLQFYRAAELAGAKVLLKAERVVKSDSKFYELDITLTLKENLAKRTIIEFPTLYVVLKDHSDMYDVIDSDEEESVDEESLRNRDRRKRTDNQQARGERSDTQKKEPLNYFFNAEFTDSEEEIENSRNSIRSKPSSQIDVPRYDELVKMKS